MACETLQGKYAEKLEREIKKMNKEIELLYKKLDAQDKIIDEQALEISKLKGILQEIYERAINTNITSLDLRDYLIVLLGDKENE